MIPHELTLMLILCFVAYPAAAGFGWVAGTSLCGACISAIRRATTKGA